MRCYMLKARKIFCFVLYSILKNLHIKVFSNIN
jgi:hypothetical protein